ncbi:hypothetical protein GCM10027589_00480 [Actinocorallia lasiicapitis]
MSYEPRLAAALSGATLRQLQHWRKPGPDGIPILVPEISPERPILYSFKDIVALRTCVHLRREQSLQSIRKALTELRFGLGFAEHLSAYKLVADQSTIYLVEPEHATDLVRRGGQIVIDQFIDVLRPFYVQGRQIPDLMKPREHLEVDPEVRGGEPVIEGTRVPYEEVAGLLRDGVSPERIQRFYPQVSPEAARDALDFAKYVDSYRPQSGTAA